MEYPETRPTQINMSNNLMGLITHDIEVYDNNIIRNVPKTNRIAAEKKHGNIFYLNYLITIKTFLVNSSSNFYKSIQALLEYTWKHFF